MEGTEEQPAAQEQPAVPEQPAVRDPTVEGEGPPGTPAKRPRGRPPSRTLPTLGSREYTGGCPGHCGKGYYHMAAC